MDEIMKTLELIDEMDEILVGLDDNLSDNVQQILDEEDSNE